MAEPTQEGSTLGWILSEADGSDGFLDAGLFRAETRALVRAGLLQRGRRFAGSTGGKIQHYVITAKGRRAVRRDRRDPMPRENKGPPPKQKWLAGAITRPGKLGGAGFLSKPVKTQKGILDRCERQYGYRSCLGSVMVLQRIPHTQAKWGKRLAQLKGYLVKKYGGPGSFSRGPVGLKKGKRRLPNPHKPGHFILLPELTGDEAVMVKTNPGFEAELGGVERELAGAKWESDTPVTKAELYARYEREATKARRKKKIEKVKRGISSVMRSALRGT